MRFTFCIRSNLNTQQKKSISNAVPQEGCIVALMVILINKENNYALFFKFKSCCSQRLQHGQYLRNIRS